MQKNKMNMPIKAMIFDFDLTLVDSSEAVTECALLTLSQFGINNIDGQKIKRTIGMTLENSFLYLTGTDNMEKARQYKTKYINNADLMMTNETKWMPGAKDTIQFLKKTGIKTGIVSTKINRRIKEFLENENMFDRFDVIIGGDDVVNNKPDAEGLVKTIEMLGVMKDEVIYIGDSTIDQETAYNAGIKFIAVLTGETKNNEFDAKKVFCFIKKINSLKNIV